MRVNPSSSTPNRVVLQSEPLSPASSLAERKRALFVKVLREEFLRELIYLWEVANGRAQSRDTLTQKILAPVQKLASQNIVPIVGTVLSLTSQVALFAVSQRRDRQLAVVASLQHSLDISRLRLLLDVVAREALRRYESFIVDRLSDDLEVGVILCPGGGAAYDRTTVSGSPAHTTGRCGGTAERISFIGRFNGRPLRLRNRRLFQSCPAAQNPQKGLVATGSSRDGRRRRCLCPGRPAPPRNSRWQTGRGNLCP